MGTISDVQQRHTLIPVSRHAGVLTMPQRNFSGQIPFEPHTADVLGTELSRTFLLQIHSSPEGVATQIAIDQ